MHNTRAPEAIVASFFCSSERDTFELLLLNQVLRLRVDWGIFIDSVVKTPA